MKIVFTLIVAYLIGSIPAGLWIGQVFSKKISVNMEVEIPGQPIPFVYLEKKQELSPSLLIFLKGHLRLYSLFFFI